MNADNDRRSSGGSPADGRAGGDGDDLLGTLWFEHDQPVVDMACLYRAKVVLLDQKGGVTLCRDGEAGPGRLMAVARPLGLAAGPEGRLVFVDGDGRIVELSLTEDDYDPLDPEARRAHIVHAGATEPIECFAVSPLGTVVAFAAAARRQVSGFFLDSEIVRTLADGIERPSALGFAADGRLLAAGTAAGEVRIVDLGGREVTLELRDDRFAGSAVSAVAGSPDDGWLVAYENQRLAHWDGDGELAYDIDTKAPVACLAVDERTGAVAFGTSHGAVHVRDASLGESLADGRVVTGALRRIAFMGIGDELVCAGAGGEVRYLAL